MLYRIDTFSVPQAARAEFERYSYEIIAFLRSQPGFIRDDWFERVAGDEAHDVVTIAVWKDDASIAAAGQAVRAMRSESGSDVEKFLRTSNVTGSRAVYRQRQAVTEG